MNKVDSTLMFFILNKQTPFKLEKQSYFVGSFLLTGLNYTISCKNDKYVLYIVFINPRIILKKKGIIA